ncbi:transcriptional regulator [Acidovorax sp. CF316]|uniref:LysR family transcriptional regulator n=1 Tax=Acidovorax sp. CF316 TaxID=1144317 RepID=UPI00026BD81E|nr:LysR family transcriptional regulator [Acidovorax sp. CF316]EJE50039.1 transcriptional regulator [Acidovorax sp. CF316]
MDIRRSDLPLLISLDALLDELNVTRAARRLNISQPSLSGQLAKLRDLFEDPLLVPSENGRGMVPTHRALELKPRLSEALNQLRGAVELGESFDPASARRAFVIAANDSVFSILGLAALGRIVGIGNPDLRVSFVPAADSGLVERMERGEVDLYLGDVGKVPGPLKSRYLMGDRFEMAQRIGHPRGKVAATLDEYCGLSHVLVSQLGHPHSQIDELLAALSRSRRVVVTVPSYNQVALVLTHTDCVATLPSHLLRRYAQILEILPAPFEIPPFNLAMAWHARAQEDAGHRWLRALFVSAVAQQAGEAAVLSPAQD